MNLDSFTITAGGVIQVRMDNGGVWHRYCLAPGADISAQPQEVKAAAEIIWTDGVINAWKTAP